MRADRLVAILLLLQQRGLVTAAEVADELEISERTARRDLEALGMAGIPVYSSQGRGGGWRLAGGGKTDLSGLTAAEARALFLVAGPSSEATPEIKAALRKLVRALPESFRSAAEAASTAVVVDPVSWDGSASAPRRAPPHLDAAQRAVVEGVQIELGYSARDGRETTRTVHPLGLATKGAVWYLIGDTDAGLRTFRVDRIRTIELTDAPVVRPEGFVLHEAWQLITDEVDEKRLPVRAVALAAPGILHVVRWMFATRVRIGPARADGRVEVELRGADEHVLAAEIAGLGADLEVLSPPAVRAELAALAIELGSLYGRGTG